MKENKPNIDTENLKKLKKYLETDPKLIIITHASPDGDAIGAALGLYAGLKSIGISISVACIDRIPEFLSFVPFANQLQQNFDENQYDAVCFVDCGNKKMTKFHETKPKILSDKIVKISDNRKFIFF